MPLLVTVVLINIFILSPAGRLEAKVRSVPSECTYEMQVWNVNTRSSVNQKKVRHAYHDLRMEEIDPNNGCTVCLEDQTLIDIPPLAPFQVCYKIAPRVRSVLGDMVRRGAPIHTVVGYHMIKSRGPVDGNGNRTEFSNHSFGTAIDINPEQNGLYDTCSEFGPQCRLLRGGEWKPGTLGTIEVHGNIYRAFKDAGFHWGGEIAGKQKDFMHFSLTGY